jgi:hypothetical protein
MSAAIDAMVQVNDEFNARIAGPGKWESRLREAFPEAFYSRVTGVLNADSSLLNVYLDLIMPAAEGDELAYKNQGPWRQARVSCFEIAREACLEECDAAFVQALADFNFRPTSFYKDPS